MPLPQPRVLGGFAVIPTGSTLLHDVADPQTRAEIIRRCRMALDALEAGLVDARDETVAELNERHLTFEEIANLFRVANRRVVLQAQPDATVVCHAAVRGGARRRLDGRDTGGVPYAA